MVDQCSNTIEQDETFYSGAKEGQKHNLLGGENARQDGKEGKLNSPILKLPYGNNSLLQ